MRPHRLGTALSVLGVCVGAAAFVSLAGAGSSGKAGNSASTALRANFISSCRFSHQSNDDPIVYPNQFGKSHLHQFIGNDSTNAASTLASLQAATTSCRRTGDTAAYWTPALIQGTTPVTPTGATIYYRRLTVKVPRAFPAGLKMIAGSSMAMTAQNLRVTSWNCGPLLDVANSSEIPTCPDGANLRLHIRFPSCWDGKNLDSADHHSHMAYVIGRGCPKSHPVSVPAIELIMKYPVVGGAGYQLSSGGQFSGHADFFNAWNQQELKRLVAACLNAGRRCGTRG
jgi:Domain of unknown function (DUF1996)